ncbi:hypothetical protein ACIOHE_04310 [Streptomyces sp. NPDC087851]|uniref:hypothetical protein n=1 Tax=Streptomyces sp. NPDC087851 TaxID=3365810 RepID=UPI00380BFCAF
MTAGGPAVTGCWSSGDTAVGKYRSSVGLHGDTPLPSPSRARTTTGRRGFTPARAGNTGDRINSDGTALGVITAIVGVVGSLLAARQEAPEKIPAGLVPYSID